MNSNRPYRRPRLVHGKRRLVVERWCAQCHEWMRTPRGHDPLRCPTCGSRLHGPRPLHASA